MAREFPGGIVVRITGFHAMARVQSLVGELRSCKPHGTAQKKRKDGTSLVVIQW